MSNPLSADVLHKMNAYFRAANSLSVGQIYLFDNPLPKEPLQAKHIKPRGRYCVVGTTKHTKDTKKTPDIHVRIL
jgi:phosphoketolase